MVVSGCDGDSLTNAIADNDYVAFTVPSMAGYRMKVMELIATLTAPSGGVHAAALASASGFAVSNAICQYALAEGLHTNHLFDLTGTPELLAVSNSVEVRVYLWGAEPGATVALGRCDGGNVMGESDIVIRGTVHETTPPSVPQSVAAVAETDTVVNVGWDACTDNVAVAGYRISWNGEWIDSVTGTTYRHEGLAPWSTNTYMIVAFDDEMNQSTQSTSATAVTPYYGPVAVPQASTLSGNLPLTVDFSSTASYHTVPGGIVVSSHWEFGDGDSSDLAEPSHQYTNTGTFQVVLTVHGDGGREDSGELEVLVVPEPAAAALATAIAAVARARGSGSRR
jgi:hypothetical protein